MVQKPRAPCRTLYEAEKTHVGACGAEDVGTAPHGVAIAVRVALSGADALGDRADIRAGFGAAVGPPRRAQMSQLTRLAGPDLLSVVLTAFAAGLVCLELGDAAHRRAHRRADGRGVIPSVRGLVVALVGVSNAAEARLGAGVIHQ